MLGVIGFVLFLCAVIAAVVTGSADAVTDALLQAPEDSVKLILSIGGAICFFSGCMKVAESSGLVRRLSEVLAHPLGRLMPQLRSSEMIRNAVTLNLSCNVFGLGNAATPFGREAARLMYRERVDRSLAVFLILNTCSVQLIPATVLALRGAAGSASPARILPAVWLVQVLSCAVGLLLVRIVFRRKK